MVAGMSDLAAVEPVTVWAIRLGEYADEVRGTLTLDPETLRFEHHKGTKSISIPIGSIRRTKRVFGSPVLIVDFFQEEHLARMAFYFAQPPPLDGEPMTRKRRRQRKENMTFLMRENAAKRDLVRDWRQAVDEAVREARR
jgi:hypothetical protein